MRISDWSSDVCSSDLEDIVGAKCVAAAFDEGEHPAERRRVEPRIGRGGADLGQHALLAEGSGAGNGHDVLGENVERAGAELLVIEHAFLDGVEGRATFEIFEAVAGDQDRFARLVEPVVGAAAALEEARAALGRPHLHAGVELDPVKSEEHTSETQSTKRNM